MAHVVPDPGLSLHCADADATVQAEENLKAVIKDPQSVEALLTQVTQSQNPAVRTVAAVQLRKSIAKHWADLPPEARTTPSSRPQRWAAMVVEPRSIAKP